MGLNHKKLRVGIDPILTQIALGHTQPDLVGNVLFPRVDVTSRSGTVIEFGKEAFKKYELKRAPGSQYKTIDFGYAGKPVALTQEALSAKVPEEDMEEADKATGIKLSSEAVSNVLDIIELSQEIAQADKARDAAGYPAAHKVALTGSNKWTDAASTPVEDVNAGIKQVRVATGKRANTIVFSASAFDAIVNHADVKDRFKYTSSDSVTEEMLAKFFKVKKVVVGEAITIDDAGVPSDVWGNDVIIAYVPVKVTNTRSLSYGYTYHLKNHPQVKRAWFDETCDSYVHKVKDEWEVNQTSIESGYLIQNAV